MAETRKSRIAKIAPWIVSLWVIAMISWYAWTAVRAVQHPLNAGDDLKLAYLWLAFVAAVVLSHVLSPRRIATMLWSASLAAVGLAMIILSGQLVAALITVWLLTLSWTWGDWLLRRMGAKPSDIPLEWLCLTLSVGLALLSLVGLALLLAQHMSALWTWTLLLLLSLIQWRSLHGWSLSIRRAATVRCIARKEDVLPEQSILLVSVGLIGLFNLAWALAPEIHYDALYYHLAVPKVYLAEHRLVYLSHGVLAHLVEMIFTIALALHGQVLAKLLVLAMGVIAAFGVYALGRSLFNPRTGLWAAALFYSTPLVSWLSDTTYIDLVVAMFLLATLLAFLRWRETRQMIWLCATGFLGGAAVGAKLNALFGLPVIVAVLLWDLLRSRHLSWRMKVKGLAGCTIAASFVSLPYFLMVYLFTGNPFSPLLNGVFRGSLAFAENLNSNASSFSLGVSPLALLHLPFALTFESERFGEALPPGAVGICLALLPLALILLFVGRAGARLLFAICVIYLALLVYTMPYARYYIPVLPIVAVLAAAAVVHFSTVKGLRRINLLCLGLAFIAQTAVIPLMFWNILDRAPIKLAFGLETQEAFLARALLVYPAVNYLNHSVKPGEKVIGVGANTMNFYLNAPLVPSGGVATLVGGSSAPTLAANLIQNGFSYVVINRWDSASSFPTPYTSQSFLDQFATLEYTANNVDVFRLRQEARELAKTNLLPNPGFETVDSAGQPTGWYTLGRPHMAELGSEAHAGKVAVRADRTGGLFALVPIEPGQPYSLGHWSRADRPNQLARLQINWFDNQMQMVDVSIQVLPTGPQWAWHEFPVMAPANASLAQVFVSVHEDSEVWFDDYMFFKYGLSK
jgi:4-amino-4-deoxy-L-arabinose transferase-like glycosyltransferase